MGAQLNLYLSEEDSDSERLDKLTRFLRGQLLELDVEDVTPVRTGPPPPGARAVDVAMIGELVVSLGQSAAALQAVLGTVFQWMGRRGEAKRMVRIELDGDVLELSQASSDEQVRLLKLFADRHAPAGDGR
ncbi:hypothetical protein AB0M50_36250 [Nonomuraea fuscirosea]|uniref:effector-associated constant component EACC1 n=1 Tax=Nonomuraea fuscirosea TaxID=1291556 RepID=UPI002DDBA385|nr:hypothetical protein [Nonomuraea fuscirosea]WSA53699.1 hypothetical protein OIE67_03415 [Nonomuraea fuscirosea]